MKPIFVNIALLFSCILSAQVFDVETLKFTGSTDNRINLVILSDGYQAHELEDFINQATTFTNEMFNESPFSEYANYFNVYAIKVPSNESGADHPTDGIFVDTFFNATYDAFGIDRLLYYEIDGNNANNTEAKILSVLADNFPNYDQALILVNSPEYGGSGGTFPMVYNGTWATRAVMHELGHSLFDLKDEYYPGDIFAGEAVNMTQETDPDLVRWKNWLNTNNVGIYQHNCVTGNCADWYKPHSNSIMESIDQNFGAVCKEAMVLKIHELTSLVDAYTPNTGSLDNLNFPLDLALNLVKPNPNTLETSWTLNGIEIANNQDMITLEDTNTNLVSGLNTIVVTVKDNSSMLKLDTPNSEHHVNTVTWTMNYNTLNIDTIEVKEDTYNIALYPNPAISYVNLKFESTTTKILSATIASIEGKVIKTVALEDQNNTKVDISMLPLGVYIVNVYHNNILLTSKKVVKVE